MKCAKMVAYNLVRLKKKKKKCGFVLLFMYLKDIYKLHRQIWWWDSTHHGGQRIEKEHGIQMMLNG